MCSSSVPTKMGSDGGIQPCARLKIKTTRTVQVELPDELWAHIFELVTCSPALDERELPTAWSESAWIRLVFGQAWGLRSHRETINDTLRRRYPTIKTLVSTCRRWRRIGAECLFKYVLITDSIRLKKLCAVFDTEHSVGSLTKRIHIERCLLSRSGTATSDLDAVVSVIRHCPSLEALSICSPVRDAISPIIDALCSFSLSLRLLHLEVPYESLSTIIWAMASLGKLECLHLDFSQPATDSETMHLGAACDISLQLPSLRQLSLRNRFDEFVEQAIGWELPALKSLSLDFCNNREDLPDIIQFLTLHGGNLAYLDLNLIPVLDAAAVLDLCPLLTTFNFNLDWLLPVSPTFPFCNHLVNRPHEHITHIGCHELLHAFGVGYSSKGIRSHMIRTVNDLNFNALRKHSFPELKVVRVLNRGLLSNLERANGPDEGCYERWERWWDQCSGMGVRLEDCTGALLGELPVDEDEGVDEGDEDGETEGSEYTTTPMGPFPELRELLNECRRMSASSTRQSQYLAYR